MKNWWKNNAGGSERPEEVSCDLEERGGLKPVAGAFILTGVHSHPAPETKSEYANFHYSFTTTKHYQQNL